MSQGKNIKTRVARYRRVPINWNDDDRIRDLGGDAFRVFWYVRTGPYMGACGGLCRMGPGLLSDSFRWQVDRVQAALDELVGLGLLEIDPAAGLFYLPRVAANVPPTNQNSSKAAQSDLDSMPDSPLLAKLAAEIELTAPAQRQRSGNAVAADYQGYIRDKANQESDHLSGGGNPEARRPRTAGSVASGLVDNLAARRQGGAP